MKKFPDLLHQSFEENSSKTGILHRIHTSGGKPVKHQPRRLLPGSPKAIKAKEAWDQLIALGIVERVDPAKATSWASALHFVAKCDGSLRPVGDYRQLNDQTDLDLYPLPHLSSFTQNITGSLIFSKVDLFKAYHQIVIDPRDRHKTCVTSPWGTFQFKRLSMGLKNSGQSFQRLLDSVIGDMKNVFCYLDDLLIYSKTQQEHLSTLEELFSRLSKAGLAISLKKCQFGVPELEYLGFKINKDGISPIKKKITALENFPQPSKQKELLGFLGALNYYRSCLPRLSPEESSNPGSVSSSRSPAAILDPLYKLATCNIKKTKGNTFMDIWNKNTIIQDAFKDAKIMLTKAVTLNFPDPNAPLALSTDASKFCLGASLDQYVDGQWKPLGLWSKTLRPEQQNYTTYLRELLAIKHAIRHFIDDINGRVLTVYTDHLPIIGTWKSPNLQKHDAVASNAISEISQWTSDIRHKPGKDLLVPDLLSRPFPQPVAKAYQLGNSPEYLSAAEVLQSDKSPEYISPSKTMAALEELAFNVINTAQLAEDQPDCPDVIKHKQGLHPKNVIMKEVDLAGTKIYCEISNLSNPTG